MNSPGDLQHWRALTFLDHIVGAIAASDDVSAQMMSIVQETTDITETQVCSLYTWDPEERSLTLTATNGLPEYAIGGVKLALGEGITGWVAEQRQPLAVLDVRDDPRFVWIPEVD